MVCGVKISTANFFNLKGTFYYINDNILIMYGV